MSSCSESFSRCFSTIKYFFQDIFIRFIRCLKICCSCCYDCRSCCYDCCSCCYDCCSCCYDCCPSWYDCCSCCSGQKKGYIVTKEMIKQALEASDVIKKQFRNIECDKLNFPAIFDQSNDQLNDKNQSNTAEILFDLLKKTYDDMKSDKEYIKHVFPLEFQLIKKSVDNNTPEEIVDCIGLSLIFKNNERLETLINEYLNTSSKNDQGTDCQPLFFYHKVPEVLLLHIHHSLPMNKIKSKTPYNIQYDVKMNLGLDLREDSNTERIQRKDIIYKLRSLINVNAESKTYNGTWIYKKHKWRNMNKQTSNRHQNIQSIWPCPYILIYERKRIPSGLINMSTQCYQNAMIQALSSSEILIKQFQDINKNQEESPCLNTFLNILNGINEMEDISENSNNLKNLSKLVNWDKLNDQDAFDWLSALLKAFQTEIRSQDSKPMPLKMKFVHTFKGINIANKIQDHLGLSLGLCGPYEKPPGVSIEFLIEQYMLPTNIDDDPDQQTQMKWYKEAPQVLIIHIQANKLDNENRMFKPEYHIIYQETLKLSLDIVYTITDEKPEKMVVDYKLKAIVCHMGEISGGHYVTRRQFNNKWFLTNDEKIEKIKFDNKLCPYIMIYEKISTSSYVSDDFKTKAKYRNF